MANLHEHCFYKSALWFDTSIVESYFVFFRFYLKDDYEYEINQF